MTRFADGSLVEVSIEIAAPVEIVWALVSDINLAAQFQDEFLGAEWLDKGPALGARFRGRNERPGSTWESVSWVTEFDPNRTFAWSVSDPVNPGSTWTYELEQIEIGTRLCYRRLLGPGPSGLTEAIERHPHREEEIIAARDETHRRNMESVLAGIRQLAVR